MISPAELEKKEDIISKDKDESDFDDDDEDDDDQDEIVNDKSPKKKNFNHFKNILKANLIALWSLVR
jgi:hypothetical protein